MNVNHIDKMRALQDKLINRSCTEHNLKTSLLLMEAAEAIGNLLACRHEWISAEDMLPTESDGTVLVCMPNVSPYNLTEPFVNAKHDRRVRVAHYSEFSNDWTYEMGGKNSKHRPTHWMPLPTPPTEKEN